jgi:hypothetical protein
VWALSNTTAQSTPEQKQMLVQKQILKAFTDCLTFTEAKILIVLMEGIENIL